MLISPEDCDTVSRCSFCHEYRKTLTSILFRYNKRYDGNHSEPTSHTNFRYLNTPEKIERLEKLHKSVRNPQQHTERLKKKVTAIFSGQVFTEATSMSCSSTAVEKPIGVMGVVSQSTLGGQLYCT